VIAERALIETGETFGSTCEVTAQDLDLAVRLTRGRHPVHVSDVAARSAGLDGRIFHGAVSAAILASAIGARFAQNNISLLMQNNRYRKPVYPGDVLISKWTVQSVLPGRLIDTYLIDLSGELRNQDGYVVVESFAKIVMN
jgi:acyl dehydratase